MYFWYYLQFCILTLKSSQTKVVNIYFSTKNVYILGGNTSKYRIRIIVVYVHATVFFFSKGHPAWYNIVNVIKPESDFRKTDKHAVGCSKAVCWGVK